MVLVSRAKERRLFKTKPKRPNSFGPTMRANQAIKKAFFSFLFTRIS